MPSNRISSIFNIEKRYLRSTDIERDFNDTSALNGYILTDSSKEKLLRLSNGLNPSSTQRAWRITGDYGTGKSSFALLLAHLFSPDSKEIPSHIKKAIGVSELKSFSTKLYPLLITGSREPIRLILIKAILDTLSQFSPAGRKLTILKKIEKAISSESVSDSLVIQSLLEASIYIKNKGIGNGLLLIIDELGKFLEYASLHPERQDVFFFQKLAEAAMRSGATPLFVVGLLHQGFNAYADQMSQSAQKEWLKVAGRFDELLFNQPLEQLTLLTSSALNIDERKLPRGHTTFSTKAMNDALGLGWYGASNKQRLVSLAKSIYPLHPSVLPVLVTLLRRFGQNERSLFSFLLSNEPYGLQDFSSRQIGLESYYRIHDLYDYTRLSFGHRLGIQSYRSHWNLIESLIDSYSGASELELKLLKTIGLLNLVDTSSTLATKDALIMAVSEKNTSLKEVSSAIKKLEKRKVIYNRGHSAGYCLWPYTSVNLERAYEDASKQIVETTAIAPLLKNVLDTRPIVARRHYIQTGNLRYFDVSYVSPANLRKAVDSFFKRDKQISDGIIYVLLCETGEERSHALQLVSDKDFSQYPNVLFAIPLPLNSLSGLVNEVQKWEWIAHNTPELNNDSYAAEEVSREVTASRRLLEERVGHLIGLREPSSSISLDWFYMSKEVGIANGRALLYKLSRIFDDIYNKAPKISNEIINRNSISSAAASARQKLIEHIFSDSEKPYMGIDIDKKPPEKSVYLSFIRKAGLHIESDGKHSLNMPEVGEDKCNILPVFNRIYEILSLQRDLKFRISEILSELARPPYGVKSGVAPILLAVFLKIHEQSLSCYENEAFMTKVTGTDFQRIIKAPETFEIQLSPLSGIREDVFVALLDELKVKRPDHGKSNLLDIVKPLCEFAAKLPAYTHKTKNLSETSLAVRKALLSAKEPAPLLFNDLPKACGIEEFKDDASISNKDIRSFSLKLKKSLDELDASYNNLLTRMEDALMKVFHYTGGLSSLRSSLSEASENFIDAVSETRLKGFCMRLSDMKLPEKEWLESLGNFICFKPPVRWVDADEDIFALELSILAKRYRNVKSILFSEKLAPKDKTGELISITKSDGSELNHVYQIYGAEEKEVKRLEVEINKLLKRDKKQGIAAISRALWKALSEG